MIPSWLHWLAILALGIGAVSACIVVADEFRRPQHMWIMNVVWPVTALFGGAAALWAYLRYGRLATKAAHHHAMRAGREPPNMSAPFPAMVGVGTTHCGAGCALGDLAAEWLAFLVPSVAVCFGWKSLFDEKMYAVWILDYLFAFALGIGFQYFTITPMRDLSPGQGLVAALKADTLSLTAWQVGMYGFMAFAQFYIFRTVLGTSLDVATPEFWFMMQIAMICGFVTSYPVNWWLIRAGIKERM